MTSPRIRSIVLTTGADFKVLTIAEKPSGARTKLFRMSSDDDLCGSGADPRFMFKREVFFFFKQQQSENNANLPWNRNL